ncbi:MAG TPA: BamA/TamA family outer membrane protein [Mucilaginibacter sp.]
MKIFLKVSIVITGILFANRLFAQENKPVPITTIPVKPKTNAPAVKDTTISNTKGVKQKDVADILEEVFKIKPISTTDSVTSKPTISIIPALGYSLVSRLGIVLSGNVAFRTGPQSRISTIVASTAYTQNKQYTLPVQTSIWSKNNKYNYVGEYRFYKYPQSTFGLGSSSNIKNEDPMDYSYFQFNETVLRHITGNLYAGVGYVLDDHWNVSDKGNLNGTLSDYAAYGKLSHSIASGFTLTSSYDSRDNGLNPSKGGYAFVQYRANYGFLGSTSSWQSLIIDLRKYYRFPEGSDNVIAFWSYDCLTIGGKPAYVDLPSNQWDPSSATGRGYIKGRFRGAQMVYAESEYRYKITANGLIGGVFFLNLESLSGAPGTRLQAIQPGFGPGLRIKLNTISKTNVSLDYGFGRQGSNGLFIDLGEAF